MFLFVTLLDSGMDYNIFILTRIHEESSKDQKLNDAIVHAIEQTGGIITAAAIILACSLGALMLSSDLLLTSERNRLRILSLHTGGCAAG